MAFDSISKAVDDLFQLSAIQLVFSFNATIASVDSEVFYGVKKVALPNLTKERTYPASHYEGELQKPVEEADIAVNCLVLPASFFPRKPYGKFGQDVYEDAQQGKKWLN